MVSQAERVYNHLQIFGSITNAQAHEMYGIRHLPSVIRDIKEKYKVEFDKERLTGCNRFGDKVWWEKYILKQTVQSNDYWKSVLDDKQRHKCGFKKISCLWIITSR